MKNRIIAFATILFISLAAMAQSSMTDDQVLKYLVTETQKGTSQQKMASELLKKGVTTTQLQRVRKKAEKLREEAGSTGKKDKKKDKRATMSWIWTHHRAVLKNWDWSKAKMNSLAKALKTYLV